MEWVNIKYHSVYDPEQAFEMIIEWMVATGNSIAEIVMGWSRKTTSTGLHLGIEFIFGLSKNYPKNIQFFTISHSLYDDNQVFRVNHITVCTPIPAPKQKKANQQNNRALRASVQVISYTAHRNAAQKRDTSYVK